MKKMALLVCALVLALPGCGCRSKKETSKQEVKKDRVKTYAQMADEDELIEIEMDDMPDDEDVDIDINFDDWSDEELDKYLNELEGEDNNSEEDALEMDLDEEDMQAFNWGDAQADDELKKIYFTFNHYGVREDQKESLAHDIEQVKQLVAEGGNLQPTVVIEGHTCQEGAPSYNVGLSEMRAKTVADLFVAAGIDREAIKVVGRGQECPAVLDGKVVNGSRNDRAPNRRVEVRVLYT